MSIFFLQHGFKKVEEGAKKFITGGRVKEWEILRNIKNGVDTKEMFLHIGIFNFEHLV